MRVSERRARWNRPAAEVVDVRDAEVQVRCATGIPDAGRAVGGYPFDDLNQAFSRNARRPRDAMTGTTTPWK